MKPIYDYHSYKTYLEDLIGENGAPRGYQAKLARAANCQPSYLSQVLTGKANLLEDHGAGIARFLALKPVETEVFLTLIRVARATSPELKRLLEEKLAQMKAENSELLKRIPKAKRIAEALESFYFSSWTWMAVHLATSISDGQSPEAIAQRLHLPLGRVTEILEELKKYDFVKHEKGRWSYLKGAGHLPRDSNMTELHHTHWRHRAILDVQLKDPASLHYTSTFTMTKLDYEKIRELLTEAISRSREISDPSVPEELYCFNLDLFQV